MSSIESPYFLETLKNEAKHSQPGILPKNTKFESYVGHNVINLSNTTLEENQMMNKMKLLIRKSSQNLNLNQTGDPPHQIEHWTSFKDPSNKKS